MALDLTEFEALNMAAPDRKPCAVDRGLEGLDGVEAVQAAAALARTDIRPGAIEKWFARRDKKVSSTSVVNHRKQRCACYD